MKHNNPTLQLVLLAAILLVTLIHPQVAQAEPSNKALPASKVSSGPSCVYPKTYEQRVVCRAIESQILAVTVRIEMQGWNLIGDQRLPLTKGGKSHATIVAGRYLVTHNHFKYSLTQNTPAGGEGYTGISIRTSDEGLLVDNAPLSIFRIAYRDTQTLVLEFVDRNGLGLFENLGLPSSPVLDWKSVNWQVGMELAHIDWNGETAHVDWVEVENLITDGPTPHVQANNFAMKGASGGGAFWNGMHIGNIWARNLEVDSNTGEVTRLYTLIALNAPQVEDLD